MSDARYIAIPDEPTTGGATSASSSSPGAAGRCWSWLRANTWRRVAPCVLVTGVFLLAFWFNCVMQVTTTRARERTARRPAALGRSEDADASARRALVRFLPRPCPPALPHR